MSCNNVSTALRQIVVGEEEEEKEKNVLMNRKIVFLCRVMN